MTLTLDREKPAGEIHGGHETFPLAKWEQDGFLFTYQGELIEEALDDAGRKRLDEVLRRRAALEQARKAFLEASPGTDPAVVNKLISEAALTSPDTTVDFAKWLADQRAYPFASVTKAIREQFNVGVTSKRQALEVLAENGLAPHPGGLSTIPSA